MLTGINKIGDLEWEVPIGYVPDMRVPGRFFLSRRLAETLEEGAVRQLANVATLPGIVKHSLAMPDIHWGYGFPIGGVAAFDMTEGVISPGGVGFDINCGVRLITTPLIEADLAGKKRELIERLFDAVPTGVGAKSAMRISNKDLSAVMVDGARWAVERGLGTEVDLVRCEGEGAMPGADPDAVSAKARQRGLPQLGTLGAGNHFLEVQVAREIVDPEAAKAFGIAEGQVCFMVHCGSRGLGHQVATDHLRTLEGALPKYGIRLPDRQLACAPIDSPEGRAYYGGMVSAANYAWANRQVIMHEARKVFAHLFGIDYDEMRLIYDVAHNVAKFERHDVDGVSMEVCVHRKGATRAFGPGAEGVPRQYAAVGQPVIIPGSMGTSSYLLHGTTAAMQKTWGSTCHGAGRVLSRSKAKKEIRGKELRERLAGEGILVRAHSDSVLAEEAPDVYKPSGEVVRVVHEAGLSKIVARLDPLGVIKG
ncbi:RNA-splicing ligase RtcB [Methanoculleus chikugoensis]|jgi:tRNA-splicing ligase RtcB|uniref:tRNA-splicing ligase RtcB n=1 Tax=Methanoculleus chikugoensis TaxID=118126 RepID=A0A1M4MLE2_9EURY|nr:RtcB family protein [Methanoculleus chikugoensis]MDD4566394.1 RtcB family protein [Methanoculleus chikugoensis]SCL75754.1 RNA-splicing ligase RtcB [Methanoculleus chikugoensis]